LSQQGPIYQHAKCPEWGCCTIEETLEDRTTFKFDDGSKRTIRHDHIGLMQRVELDEAEATAFHARMAKRSAPRAVKAASTAAAKAKKAAIAKKAAAASASAGES
jgi:hypothetical protein